MTEYLRWLLESPNGRHEQAARNNHGSWYAAQTAAIALWLGDTARVRQIATDARARIGWQIRPDGEQPTEMERTRSMHYSAFNAEALTRLAEAARAVGVDLWGYESPDGGSLRRAIDRLARHAPDPATWPGRQIDAPDLGDLVMVFRRANAALPGAPYADVLRRLPADVTSAHRAVLLYP
jgi:hypothetical protein